MHYEGDRDALQGFLDESNESLMGIEKDFIELEHDPGNMEIINRIFRPVHSLKGNSGFFALNNINKFAHRLENLLDFTRQGEIIVCTEVIDVLLRGVEYLQEMLDRAQVDPTDTAISEVEELFLGEVESFQPQAAEGSVESIITLKELLAEFLDRGLSIREHTIISGLLDQIAKANIEIEKLLSSQTPATIESLYHPDSFYFRNDIDFTKPISCLAKVASDLNSQKTISNSLFVAFQEAFAIITECLKEDTNISCHLDTIACRRNFLDDCLMLACHDFTQPLQEAINAVISCFETIPKSDRESQKIGDILVEQEAVNRNQVDMALGKQKKIGELLIEEGAISGTQLQDALTIQDRRILNTNLQKNKSCEGAKTIRIDQRKLDHFADAVGGLYINLDSINYLKKQLEEADVNLDLRTRFDNTAHGLDAQLEQLHTAIMGIRRIPVRTLFQRFPKVIRQLSTTLGKDILFAMQGEETVIDKDLLEKIENPLVHILRNSIDHGLELPEEREQNNKQGQGNLTLSARADETTIHITIKDDGKGIDPAQMKKTAVAKGFLSKAEADALSDQELINLIFKPGFSSAEKISDVSGRGVGMDVVISALKECNGSINVDSLIGEGTTVAIAIPLSKTLVTKDALITKAGDEVYIIPTDDVTAVIESENIIAMLSQENCISYEDELLRLIDLNKYFYPQAQEASLDHNNKNIVICRDTKVGLIVDEILNNQKIVVKEFPEGYRTIREIEGVSGYTIMGNEEINLIVDVMGVSAYDGGDQRP